MELRQFTYVDMVASCGSFTKAAAKLFISQPALSNYIGKVEEELGVKLFDRSSTPLTLTYAGEQYLKRARVILGQIHEMDKEIRDITQNMKGKIRLGFPSERIIYMLPLLLAPFKEKYPGIDVEVITGPGNRLTEGLRAGETDFVFLPTWVPQKDIIQEEICQEELVLVAAKGYLPPECMLDQEKKVINWKKVAKFPVITLKKGHALRSSVEVLFRNADAKPDIGVAVIPEITLELMQGSMEAEVYHLSQSPITWEVSALYREGAYIGQVERDLLEIAKNAMRQHKKKL